MRGEAVEVAVRELLRQMVRWPDQVRVERHEDAIGSVVLEIDVAPEDRGRVIGRKGVTARSLQTIVTAMGIRHGHCELRVPRWTGEGR